MKLRVHYRGTQLGVGNFKILHRGTQLGVGNLKFGNIVGPNWELGIWEFIARNHIVGGHLGKQKHCAPGLCHQMSYSAQIALFSAEFRRWLD